MPPPDPTHAALEEAIEASARANDIEGLLMEWVVVAAFHVVSDDDGPDYTTVDHVSSENLPIYRGLGLVQNAVLTFERQAMNLDEDDG